MEGEGGGAVGEGRLAYSPVIKKYRKGNKKSGSEIIYIY